jgi:N-acetylglucosamine kinase-like BadF-type ATPase
VPTEAVGSAVFGIAGAGAAAVQEQMRGVLGTEAKKRGLTLPPLRFETDARIALEGAFAGGPGIIVIAGTGSAVLGKSSEGEIRLVGGWGRTLGDEGSGYFTGLEALRALARMMDGREESTLLRRKLETEFGLDSRQKLVQAVYQEGFAIPSLAPAVVAAAEEGDSAAASILRKGLGLLGEQAGVLARSYRSLPEVGVVFVGGLIDHEGLPARMLSESLRLSAPSACVRLPLEPPALGALRLARHILSTQR